MEDLWGFNDEGVANAIFNCGTPVISAVGHETDFTIADFVSDLRAPTPSAAAELAVCDVSLYLSRLLELKKGLNFNMNQAIRNARITNGHFIERLELLSPVSKLNDNKKRLENIKDDLRNSIKNLIIINKHRLEIDAGKLHGLSPLVKLSSGYAYVTNAGQNVKCLADVSVGDTLKINVTDGYIVGTVNEKHNS